MTLHDIGWAAGLFEGEGTITISANNQRMRNGLPLRSLQLALGMTDEDVVRRFHAVVEVGGVLCIDSPSTAARGHKPIWRWSCRNGPAIAVAEKLLPYLGQRRQARFAEAMREVADNRSKRGEVARLSKFSADDLANMRSMYEIGLTPKVIREHYGISEGYLTKVLAPVRASRKAEQPR